VCSALSFLFVCSVVCLVFVYRSEGGVSSQGSFTGDELVLMPLDEAERMLSLQMALKLADLGVRCDACDMQRSLVGGGVGGWVRFAVSRVINAELRCEATCPGCACVAVPAMQESDALSLTLRAPGGLNLFVPGVAHSSVVLVAPPVSGLSVCARAS
jgi:hypothetical protein